MTTRLPTRDQLTSMLAAVREEPESPDQAAAIQRLEEQLAALDAGEGLTGPDADLVEPQDEALEAGRPARPAAPQFQPAAVKPAEKPDKKPF